MATAVDEFTPDTSISGYIQATYSLGGYSYVPYSGVNAKCGKNYAVNPTYPTEQRAFFSFDTSSIPSDAVISTVRFYLSFTGLSNSNGPDNWKTRWYMGTFIGGSLDSSDWNAGTSMNLTDWPGAPGSPTEGWVSFRAAAASYVNIDGMTDVRMIDYSDESFPWGSWSFDAYNSVRTKLEVTYDYTPVVDDGASVFYNLGG